VPTSAALMHPIMVNVFANPTALDLGLAGFR
jgi:hypothetical protein